MEPSAKNPKHFLQRATDISEASCFGRYMGVKIEKLLVNVPITGHSYNESKKANFTLVRVLFYNLWDHCIPISTYDINLIDTEGIQHRQSDDDDLYVYQQETEVSVSKKRKLPYDFESPADILEGKAKTRGWLWFPALPQGIFPHRILFNFNIFEPGYTSGSVEDHETLEVAFEFNFRQLLPDTTSFVRLEIEDV